MTLKFLLLLAGVWVTLATSHTANNTSTTTITHPTATTNEEPSGRSITPSPDVTAEVIILASPSDVITLPHDVSPTVESPSRTPVTISPTSASPHVTEPTTSTWGSQDGPRVLAKRSEARGLLQLQKKGVKGGVWGGLGVCSPPTATHYLTVTSTVIAPTVTYATATQYIPTVISKVRIILVYDLISFRFSSIFSFLLCLLH